MANLPGNVATPTLVTGKTDKSQVIDAYSGSPIEAKAQNLINSVLNSTNGTILETSKNALVKVIDSKRFYNDLGTVINKFAKGGFSKESFNSALSDWKKGALGTILQANGVKDLDGLKNNLIGAVETNVKDFAFGNVKGFVDTLQPGLLDSVGVKSFSDAKKIYDNIDHNVRAIADMNTEAWINATTPFVVGLSSVTLQASVDIINATLGTESKPITLNSTDREIDNAILTGVSKDIIAEDTPILNDFLFTNFGDIENPTNLAKMELFVSTTVNDAATNGSIDYLVKAANMTSSSFVRANVSTPLDDFLKAINFKTKFTNETERLEDENKIINAIEILTDFDRNNPNLDVLKSLSDDAREVLKYSPTYASATAISETLLDYTPTSFTSMFPDYVIV